ncbi:NAD(P)H-flavin reductase [Paraglaciecola hydrolytica]|uniref:NAD(P)H-flavin reductase n=1 Tax=Paraglaciecola hydrolytica TaxID=1799789 RepID=A0A136A736_9ALTE|nr:NAD(P)H-flavin reductase [Paraglaciecola hydrolytica]KXI31014.1 NAD(P)H-flavin reductase [Paraglaciecola hydrolytica]
MQKILCKVESIEPLTNTIVRVQLQPATELAFIAGQYLQVIMGETDKRAFSIANAPRQDGSIELHIGADPANQYACQVVDKMREQGEVLVEGGLGNAFLRDHQSNPTILLAGGTGFSYTLSILQQLLSKPLQEPLFLYWGTRTLTDMYAYDTLKHLARQHSKFTFVPVIEHPESNWQGKTGWVHKAVLADFTSLQSYQVYLAGRFEMAGVAREDFHQQGLQLANIYGDAFEFI